MLVEPWRITLLGDCKAEQTTCCVTRFRTRKAASLFGFLACFPQRSHAREEIADRFWPDDALESGRAKLRLALASLRRQLEPPGILTGTVLFADRTCLRLNAHSIETDVAAFEADIRAGDKAQDWDAQIASWERAVLRYGGDLLPGDYEEWALAERERLKASYLRTLECLVEGLQGGDDLEKPIRYARRLVSADPLREETHLALMRLYLRVNRPHDAARQYQYLQTALRDGLNATPGREATELAATLPVPVVTTITKSSAIPAAKRAQSASALMPETCAAFVPPRQSSESDTTSAPTPTYANLPLPVFLTRCFGREADIRNLTQLLCPKVSAQSDTEAWRSAPFDVYQSLNAEGREPTAAPARCVTLTGPGGAGKTRLAVETARELQANDSLPAAFVNLADITEPEWIARAILDGLRLPPASSGEEFAALFRHLPQTRMLLILDNFEQLMPGGSLVVEQLLTRLPLLSTLITSRHRLAIPGERVYEVEALSEPHSELLFVDRAQAVRPDFQRTPRNANALAALCSRLEGLPLALELAGAWAGTLTPTQMLANLEAHLESRFDLLVSRRGGGAERHQTLRAAIAWSVDLLSPDLQAFLTQVTVFRGGWSLEAAETVCGQPHALHLLSQLRERSLVVADSANDSEEMRFRLLESVREFAGEQWDEPPREATRRAHADYFLSLAETADREFNGPEQALWFTRLEQEHNNVRAALQWFAERADRVESELRLASAMQVFWWTRGYIREGRDRLNDALCRPGIAAHPKAQRKALAAAGILANMQGDYAAGREYHERALQIARAMEDWPGIAIALGSLGNIAKNTGDYPRARQLYLECLAISERFGHKTMRATAIMNLGNVAKETGAYAEAQKLYEQCLALHRTSGNAQGMALTLGNLAGLNAEKGDVEAALPFVIECLELCRELGDQEGVAFALEVFAEIAKTRRDWPRSACLYAAAAHLRERIGTPLTGNDEQARHKSLTELREHLGSLAIHALWNTDTGDELEEAIQFALEIQPTGLGLRLARSG